MFWRMKKCCAISHRFLMKKLVQYDRIKGEKGRKNILLLKAQDDLQQPL